MFGVKILLSPKQKKNEKKTTKNKKKNTDKHTHSLFVWKRKKIFEKNPQKPKWPTNIGLLKKDLFGIASKVNPPDTGRKS